MEGADVGGMSFLFIVHVYHDMLKVQPHGVIRVGLSA